MARKITQLPLATTLAPNDRLVIVETATGLSKQIRGELVGGSNADETIFFSDMSIADDAVWDTSGTTGTGSVLRVDLFNLSPEAAEGFGVWELLTGSGNGRGEITFGVPPAFYFRGSLVRVLEARVFIPTVPTDATFSIGFNDAQLVDACVFYYDEGVGTWNLGCVSSAGGGGATDATAIAAASGWQTIRIEIEPAVEARAYVDDVLVATVTDATAVPQDDDRFTIQSFCSHAAGPKTSAFIDWIRARMGRA